MADDPLAAALAEARARCESRRWPGDPDLEAFTTALASLLAGGAGYRVVTAGASVEVYEDTSGGGPIWRVWAERAGEAHLSREVPRLLAALDAALTGGDRAAVLAALTGKDAA